MYQISQSVLFLPNDALCLCRFLFLSNQTDDCVLRNFKYINVGYTSEKLWHSGGGLTTIYYDIKIDCSDIWYRILIHILIADIYLC